MFFSIKFFDRMLDIYFGKCSQVELAKSSILFAVGTSIFLILIKAVALFATGSISMRASFNDSCLDMLISFSVFHALKFSSIKYDVEHNFGHEKVEGIVAIFQCLFVMYSGFVIFQEAYEVVLNPKYMSCNSIGIAIMIISCICVYQLIYFQKYVVSKTDSMIVKGDSLHYISDFFTNVCIIFSLFLSRYFVYVDVVCGVAIGSYVFYSAFIIMRNAINDLMDNALPRETQKNISDVINSIKEVSGIKIIRTRSAGMKKYVEARIFVDKKLSISEADKISIKVENEIGKLFENIDVIVKVEPTK